MNFIHVEAARTPGLAQRLESDVETDLVPILERIGYGLGNAVDAHALAFDPVRLDRFGERFAAEAEDAQRRIGQRGSASPAIDRDPYLVRKLGADAVEGESGKQAYDAMGHGGSREDEPMVFRDRRVTQA